MPPAAAPTAGPQGGHLRQSSPQHPREARLHPFPLRAAASSPPSLSSSPGSSRTEDANWPRRRVARAQKAPGRRSAPRSAKPRPAPRRRLRSPGTLRRRPLARAARGAPAPCEATHPRRGDRSSSRRRAGRRRRARTAPCFPAGGRAPSEPAGGGRGLTSGGRGRGPAPPRPAQPPAPAAAPRGRARSRAGPRAQLGQARRPAPLPARVGRGGSDRCLEAGLTGRGGGEERPARAPRVTPAPKRRRWAPLGPYRDGRVGVAADPVLRRPDGGLPCRLLCLPPPPPRRTPATEKLAGRSRFPEILHHCGCRRPGTAPKASHAPKPCSAGRFEGRAPSRVPQTQRHLHWGVEVVPRGLPSSNPSSCKSDWWKREGAAIHKPKVFTRNQVQALKILGFALLTQ